MRILDLDVRESEVYAGGRSPRFRIRGESLS